MKLSGNTIFLTGGSSGIGKSLAKEFLELGNEVIICSRNEAQLKKTVEEIPGLHYVRCDINSGLDRKEAFTYIQKEFPKMNVLINNAVVQSDYDLKAGEEGLENMDYELSLTLNAPIHLTGIFMPHLLQAENPAIINVTSILGYFPVTRIPIYCAGKAGFHAYTMILRKQLEDTNIKVYEVIPPKVETNLNAAGRFNARFTTEAHVGLAPDSYAKFVIEKLGEDVQDIFCPPDEKLVYELPRGGSESMRLK